MTVHKTPDEQHLQAVVESSRRALAADIAVLTIWNSSIEGGPGLMVSKSDICDEWKRQRDPFSVFSERAAAMLMAGQQWMRDLTGDQELTIVVRTGPAAGNQEFSLSSLLPAKEVDPDAGD